MGGMRRLLVGAVAALTLAGCGSSSSTTASDGSSSTAASSGPTSSAPASTLPACTAVWVTGSKLPRAYAGCHTAAGDVRAHKIGCSSGQTIVIYTQSYYAVLGGSIHHAANILKDQGYLHSIRSCRA
jgi:uncharacterized protein YcfL